MDMACLFWALAESSQEKVTGKVKLRIHRGSMRVVGRESMYSIYKESLATYDTGSTFDQNLAKGFSELWGLQSIIANSICENISCPDCGANFEITEKSEQKIEVKPAESIGEDWGQ